MTPLFILGDILQTSKGIVLAGSLNSPLANNPSSVGFYDDSGRLTIWKIQETDFTVSLSDKINLFLLLGSIQLPSTLKLGAIIYSDHLDTNKVIATQKLSQAPSNAQFSQ